MLTYPYHISDCGDIDMLGQRKPQSFYREIAWELRSDPYIAVRHPKLCHIPYFISGWGFYECEHSWRFDGYEGVECEIYVFADCDEVVLEINGKELERQTKSENGVYTFKAPYEKGEILARAFIKGKEIGKSFIKSEGDDYKIALIKEKSYTGGDIVYVDVEIQDANGSLCTQAEREISYSVEGGEILATISGLLTDEALYTDTVRKTHRGKSLVIVKKTEKEATLTANAQGLGTVSVAL